MTPRQKRMVTVVAIVAGVALQLNHQRDFAADMGQHLVERRHLLERSADGQRGEGL